MNQSIGPKENSTPSALKHSKSMTKSISNRIKSCRTPLSPLDANGSFKKCIQLNKKVSTISLRKQTEETREDQSDNHVETKVTTQDEIKTKINNERENDNDGDNTNSSIGIFRQPYSNDRDSLSKEFSSLLTLRRASPIYDSDSSQDVDEEQFDLLSSDIVQLNHEDRLSSKTLAECSTSTKTITYNEDNQDLNASKVDEKDVEEELLDLSSNSISTVIKDIFRQNNNEFWNDEMNSLLTLRHPNPVYDSESSSDVEFEQEDRRVYSSNTLQLYSNDRLDSKIDYSVFFAK